MAQTESEPEVTPGRVDSGILEGGVSVALLDKAKDVEETGISSPEDFWTPLRPPPSKGEYKDQYGKLSPVPEHDGTECLKTDDTLWTHAEHFKVHMSIRIVLDLHASQACKYHKPPALLAMPLSSLCCLGIIVINCLRCASFC